MNEDVPVRISPELCTGCGLCVEVCPFKNISITGDKSVFDGEACIACCHCSSACPQGAIKVSGIDEGMSEYSTFTPDRTWLPYGDYDTANLVRLMSSRRSCRNYSERPVDRGMLDDLVKIGITAPSGTNSQKWSFTILPTRKAVDAFAGHIASFFRKLNAIAEKALIRIALKTIGKGELDEYYRKYYLLVKKSLDEWDESGKDRLFHGATSAIVIGSSPGASCPAEDCLLAAQNILLAAHSMGLGSCLIGFAVSAMKESPAIKRSMGIPDDETVYAVIALGYPDESYQTTPGRKKAGIRYFEG